MFGFQLRGVAGTIKPARGANNPKAIREPNPLETWENEGGARGPKRGGNLSSSQERAIRSLERRIIEHRLKLESFKKNPTVHPGMENQSPQAIKAQQDARIRHLEKEIETFQENTRKIIGENE